MKPASFETSDNVIRTLVRCLLLCSVVYLTLYPMNITAEYFPVMNISVFAQPASLFTKNSGNIDDPSVQYYLKAPGMIVYFTDTGIMMNLNNNLNGGNIQTAATNNGNLFSHCPDDDLVTSMGINKSEIIKVSFVDALVPIIMGVNPRSSKNDYEFRKLIAMENDVSGYQEIVYKKLYPDIDLRYISTPTMLKYQL